MNINLYFHLPVHVIVLVLKISKLSVGYYRNFTYQMCKSKLISNKFQVQSSSRFHQLKVTLLTERIENIILIAVNYPANH